MSVSPRQREIELTSGMGLGDYLQSRPTTQRAQELVGPLPRSAGDILRMFGHVAPAFANPIGAVGRNIADYGLGVARSLKEVGIEETVRKIVNDVKDETKQGLVQARDLTYDSAAIDQEIGRATTGILVYSASFLPGNEPGLTSRVRQAWDETPGGLFQKGRAANEAYASGNERLAGIANAVVGPSSLLTAAGRFAGGVAKVGETARAAELTGIARGAGMGERQAAEYAAKRAAQLSFTTPAARTAQVLTGAGDVFNQAEIAAIKPLTYPLGQGIQRVTPKIAPRIVAGVAGLARRFGPGTVAAAAPGATRAVAPGIVADILAQGERAATTPPLGLTPYSAVELATLNGKTSLPHALAAKIANGSLTLAERQAAPQAALEQAQKIYETAVSQSATKVFPNLKEFGQMVDRIRHDPNVGPLEMQRWYEQTWARLEPVFGSDTELMLHLLSLTSEQTAVSANATFALKAYAQFKLALAAGNPNAADVVTGLRREPMNAAARNLLRKWQLTGGYNGVEGAGIDVAYKKRTQFVNSFKEAYLHWLGQENPEKLQQLLLTSPDWQQYMKAVSATPDQWESRAWGFTDRPTPDQFELMRLQLIDAAQILGYTPRELQAMHWGDIQMRWVAEKGRVGYFSTVPVVQDETGRVLSGWRPERLEELQGKGAYEKYILPQVLDAQGNPRPAEEWMREVVGRAEAAKDKTVAKDAVLRRSLVILGDQLPLPPADRPSFDVPFKQDLGRITRLQGEGERTLLESFTKQVGVQAEKIWEAPAGTNKRYPQLVYRFTPLPDGPLAGAGPEELAQRVRDGLRTAIPSTQVPSYKATWGKVTGTSVWYSDEVPNFGQYTEPDAFTGIATPGTVGFRPLGIINDPQGTLTAEATRLRDPLVRQLAGGEWRTTMLPTWDNPATALPPRYESLPGELRLPTEPFSSGDWRSATPLPVQREYTKGLSLFIAPEVQKELAPLGLRAQVRYGGEGFYGGEYHPFINFLLPPGTGTLPEAETLVAGVSAAAGRGWGQQGQMIWRAVQPGEKADPVATRYAIDFVLHPQEMDEFVRALGPDLGATPLGDGDVFRLINNPDWSGMTNEQALAKLTQALETVAPGRGVKGALSVYTKGLEADEYDAAIDAADAVIDTFRSRGGTPGTVAAAGGAVPGTGDRAPFRRMVQRFATLRDEWDRTFLGSHPELGGLGRPAAGADYALGVAAQPRLAVTRPGYIDNPQLRTTNLRQWSGANVLADEQDTPLKFWHGSDSTFNRFTKASRGKATMMPDAAKATFFTNDPEWAGFFSEYAEGTSEMLGRESAPQVYPVYLRAKKLVYYFDESISTWMADDALAIAKSVGADGIAIVKYFPEGARTTSDLPGQVLGILTDRNSGHRSPVLLLEAGDGPPPFAGVREVVALFDPRNIKSATGNLGTFDQTARLDRAVAQPLATAAVAQQGQGVADWLRTPVLTGIPGGSRLATTGSTALIGAGVGAALPAGTGEERRQHALTGAAVGAGVAGAMTSARGYNLLRNAPQIEKFGKGLLGEMVAAQKAAQSRSDRGIANLRTLTAVWKVQATSTLRNILQDEVTARLWLNDAGVRTQLMNDNWASLVDLYNRGIRDGYEALPVEMTTILDALRPGERYMPDIGMSFAQANQGVVDTLTGKSLVNSLSAADLAKAQAALSLLSPAQGGIPLVGLLTSGLFGYYRPAQQTLFETLNNFTRVASRGAAWQDAMERTLPQAAEGFLKRVAAQGVDVSALAAKEGLFSPAEVEALLPGAGESWQLISDKVINHAEAFARDVLGDYSKKLKGEKAISAVVPFVSYAMRAVPRTAKLMLHHPGASLVILLAAAKGTLWAEQQGLPGYLGASVPIDTDVPVLGGVVRAMSGGGEGTGYLQPLQLFSPVGGQVLGGGEDLPEDATAYQRVKNVIGRTGFSPSPLVQALTYATNQDYYKPGNLSRLGGIEDVMPGPQVPSLTAGVLNVAREQAGGYPQTTTALDRRIAQVFYRTTGLALSDPAVADNPFAAALADSTLDPNSAIVQQAMKEERESQVARNAFGFHSPVGMAIQTDVQQAQNRARAAQSIQPPAAVDPALIRNLYRQGSLGAFVQARGYEQANLGTQGEPNPLTGITSRASREDRAQATLDRWRWENRAAKLHDPMGYDAAERQLRLLLGLP